MIGLLIRSSIGIEMDAREIRAVELKEKAGKPILRSWGRLRFEPDTVHDGMVQDPHKLGEALIRLWEMCKFKNKKAILGVFNQGVIIRKADFPKVPDEKIEGLIRYQAQSYLPIPVDSAALDYIVIGEYKGDGGYRSEVLLVAAQLDMVNKFLEGIEQGKIKLRDITVAPLALLNAIPASNMQGTVIIVDIANELGSLLGVIDGVPRFVRGLKLRLQDIVDPMPLPSETTGLHFTGEQLASLNEALYNEIRYFINYFLAQEELNRIDKIILSGCGSRIQGIETALQESFGVQVELYDPSTVLFNLGKNGENFKKQASDFAVSIGLAIAGLKG